MYFLVNSEKKIIFGWSAKSGCVHIKNLFCFYSGLKISKGKAIHKICGYHALPRNHQEYKIFIFVRNPYKRLVSGFLDKGGLITYPDTFKSFRRVVDQLYEHEWRYFDPNKRGHHFNPHFSEAYLDNLNITNVIDIENIDYEYFDSLFGKISPPSVREYRGLPDHIVKYTDSFSSNKPIWDINLSEFGVLKPKYNCFYNEELVDKVKDIYKKDFEQCVKFGLNFPEPALISQNTGSNVIANA